MSEFSLDRTENPHPRMLQEALQARAYWRGYLAAMAAATGESEDAIEEWMDRNASP